MAHVLVIEDEPLLARNICDALSLESHLVVAVGTGEDGIARAEADAPDIILLDLRLPGIDGLEVARELRRRGIGASIVVMTAHGNFESVVEAMRAGVSDFLTKPLDLRELDLVVDRVLAHRRVTSNLQYFRDREQANSALAHMLGESEAMEAVKRFITRIVATPALSAEIPPSVLITGETGTGKDLAARAIHYAGPRRDGPFVHVNCTALPDHLVEAELFGHVKGAFTDARGDKRGLFEVADGGAIFLDEIGHMQPGLQAKLLSALEHRTIRPVGGTSERRINVHVIAATNRDPQEAIAAGELREDLYHRLRVLALHLPPLRERTGDIPLLAEHFRELYATRFSLRVERIAPDAMEALTTYDWPGNVRELSHAIESAVLITDGRQIQAEHLNIHVPQRTRVRVELPADETVMIDFSETGLKLDDIEYRLIRAALAHTRHNASRAARILGISRDAIRYRMEKYEKEHGGPTDA